MTLTVVRVDSVDAWGLIFQPHLAMLSEIEQETMHRAIRNSTRIWVGMDGDNLVAMWGLIPPSLMSETAYLWLFTTEHLREHVFSFIRQSQRAVEEMLIYYPVIVGHTMSANRRAIQWLRWLGAEFGDPINGKVIPFTIKAKQNSWHQDSVQLA